MCIFCGSTSHVLGKGVSQAPGTGTSPLTRRSFVSGATAFGGLYAGSKTLGAGEAHAQVRAPAQTRSPAPPKRSTP